MRKKTRGKKFDKILVESIDEALVALGEKSKKSIYRFLEDEYSISRTEIPNRVSDFTNAIENVFGEAAQLIEILIMKHLQKKVRCLYEWDGPSWLVPDLTFIKYVKLMQVWFEGNETVGNVEVIINFAEHMQRH